MSFQTLKRITPLFAFVLLTVPAAFAAAPSARSGARAEYDPRVESVVMFGGLTTADAATGRAYDLDETWEFDGTRWIRRFPAGSPPGRSSHVMVYDSNRGQMVVFGGRNHTEILSDTWAYRGGWFDRRWEKIDTPSAPGARILAAAAFDPVRDRMVLFGGQRLSDDKQSFIDIFDMWEFDGTTWTRVMESGPKVENPVLAYDTARGELLLLGHDEEIATKMFRYDAAGKSWNPVTPEKLPPCVSESAVTYDFDKQLVYLIGGVCVPRDVTQSSKTTEELYAWDGTNWTLVEDERTLFRTTNAAFAYDGAWKELVIFGGNLAYTTAPSAETYMYRDDNWVNPPLDVTSPGPRSLFSMATDPVRNVIWLIGGQSDSSTFGDFWKFEDGFWNLVKVDGTPTCSFARAAFDTDRNRLVVVCGDSSTHEWDGEAWKAFPDLRNKPDGRNFSHLVYDPTLKKTVLYGGWDTATDYSNKTWTWNGTEWTEVKAKKRPHYRALGSMWYDPLTKKTVLYGGIGRKEREGRLERFNDMWSFDGSTWTEMKPSTLPGTRYGAQVAVNGQSGRTILFGGLRLDTPETGNPRQVYADDTWEWDGSNWRRVTTDGTAVARENAALAWDPAGKRFILFGGWAGYYLSDTWRLTDGRWRVFAE